MSLFTKFHAGLKRTRDATVGRLTSLFLRGKIDDELLEELENALLEADVGVDSTERLICSIKEYHKENKPAVEATPLDLVKSELLSLMAASSETRKDRFSTIPWVILLVGVNGSGKTTTAGKLAHYFSMTGKKTAIAAADTFRAAAVEQIEIWAKRGNARLIKQDFGGDPAAVTFDAYQSVMARGEDVLIVDTAGRLQDKHNLMQELAKIARVLKRFDNGTPHEILLVIDASTGQNGLSQAKGFTAATGVTGLVVTKLDGTARGGVVVPILRDLDLPIEFIGMGEGVDDLYPFDARSYVDALLEI